MIVVSFYTREGRYREFAERLRSSCERFGIRHEIEELKSTGDMRRNNALKPGFVLRKLLALRTAIVWCDADCEIMRYPALLDLPGYDLKIYNFSADQGQHVPYNPSVLEASGGVIGLNYTPAALQLLYQWGHACRRDPQSRTDPLLSKVYTKWRGPRLNAYWLPRAYNRLPYRWPHVEPVIEHHYSDGAIFRASPGDKGQPAPAFRGLDRGRNSAQ